MNDVYICNRCLDFMLSTQERMSLHTCVCVCVRDICIYIYLYIIVILYLYMYYIHVCIHVGETRFSSFQVF